MPFPGEHQKDYQFPENMQENSRNFSNSPPFSGLITSSIRMFRRDNGNSSLPLNQILDSSGFQNYLLSYLAFQEQRKIENPVINVKNAFKNPGFLPPTVLEAYFYHQINPETGRSFSSYDIVTRIADLGSVSLDSIARLNRHNQLASRVVKILSENEVKKPQDILALQEADIVFSAILASLRVSLYTNPSALKYRNITRKEVARGIKNYRVVEDHESGNIKENYILPVVRRSGLVTIPINPVWSNLTPNQQEGWLFAQMLGKTGHPLLRSLARPLIYDSSHLLH